MTSTISSNTKNKNSFFALLKWTLRESVSVTVIYSALLFLALPVLILCLASSENYMLSATYQVMIFPVSFSVSAFTIFLGAKIFAGFHDKRSVDLYASLPVKKITLFLARYTAGLLILVIPLIVMSALGGLIPGLVHNSGEYSAEYFDGYFFNIMGRCLVMIFAVIAGYTMFALLAMLCGTVSGTVISYIAINVLFPVMVALAFRAFEDIVPGYSCLGRYGLFNLPVIIFMLLSPMAGTSIGSMIYEFSPEDYVGSEFLGISSEFLGISSAEFIIFWLIFTAIALTAACIISKKRKNENVQNSFIYKTPKILIVMLTSVTVGTMMAYFFSITFMKSIVNGLSPTFVILAGGLIGASVAFLIATLVYNRGVKGFLKEIPILGVSYIIFAVGYFSISTGFFGADVYIPDVEDIESVMLSTSYNDTYLYTQNVSQSVDYTIQSPYPKNYYYDKNNELQPVDYEIKDRSVIENVIEMQKCIIDTYDKKFDNMYYITQAYYDYETLNYGNEEHSSKIRNIVEIWYRLKNNKIVHREYSMIGCNEEKVNRYINDIFSSDAYKKQYFLFIYEGMREHLRDIGVKNFSSDNYSDYKYDEYSNSEPDNASEITLFGEQKLMNIFDAFKKDFMADKNIFYNMVNYDLLYGKIMNDDYTGTDNKITLINMKFELERIDSVTEIRYYIPRESYKNTWKLIDEYSKGTVGKDINTSLRISG